MAKLEVDVLLKDGTDESTFINDVTSNTEVDLKNRLPNSPTLVVLDVEESYINTLKSHSSVESVEVEFRADAPITYPDIPTKYTVTNKTIGGSSTNYASIRGDKYLSFQHYLDTDIMVAPERTINGNTGSNVGGHHFYSDPYGKFDQIRTLGTENRLTRMTEGDQTRKTQRDKYREERKMRADARGAITRTGSKFFG